MTRLYYCLAKTVVTGEVIINDSSVTYSASSSAFDSSNVSFKDAAEIATIHSNSAATLAARAQVDAILLQYTYVLSDTAITSMINNSLKTTIQPIIPIALKSIATNMGNGNWEVNKDVLITASKYLLVRDGQRLRVNIGRFKFTNIGLVQVGERNTTDPTTSTDPTNSTAPTNKCVGCKTSQNNLKTYVACPTDSISPCCLKNLCSDTNGAGMKIYSNSSESQNNVTNTSSYTVSSGSCMSIEGVGFYNSGDIINDGCISVIAAYQTNGAGQTVLSSAFFENATDATSGAKGSLNNSVGGFVYTNSQAPVSS